MSDGQEFTTAQKELLEQFRKNLADVLKEEHDEYFLARWLRARKWSLPDAEKMLRTSLKNRATWNVDNLEKWEEPKALREYLPYGMVGYDNEGSPVLVCPFYNFDMWGTLHCVTRLEFQRYVVKLIERFQKTGYESSKKHGPIARRLVVLFDMHNFNLKQYTWRPAAEAVISSVKQYEANYPEILKMCYIINAPKLFSVAFNVVKKFLDEATISKIKVYKVGVDKWKEQMFSHVDPNIVPKVFGGNRMDPNGDPECKSVVVWGGRIPKELYVDQQEGDADDEKFTEVTVSKGTKLKLDFEISEKAQDQMLSWEFRTSDYDIKFGIYSIDKSTGEKRSEVPLGTVYCNEMDEIGFITTRPNTTYTVVFDNSSSYLRSKKLRYSVNLISETDEIGELSTQLGSTELIQASADRSLVTGELN